MKNLLIKTTASLSIFSLSLFNAKPGLTDTVYGSNSTRPDSLKVTFYQLGISNSDFTGCDSNDSTADYALIHIEGPIATISSVEYLILVQLITHKD